MARRLTQPQLPMAATRLPPPAPAGATPDSGSAMLPARGAPASGTGGLY